jgi:hypothetical protein
MLGVSFDQGRPFSAALDESDVCFAIDRLLGLSQCAPSMNSPEAFDELPRRPRPQVTQTLEARKERPWSVFCNRPQISSFIPLKEDVNLCVHIYAARWMICKARYLRFPSELFYAANAFVYSVWRLTSALPDRALSKDLRMPVFSRQEHADSIQLINHV